MKRILALSLSLFVLANTITVSQTQAIPKPVKVAGKVISGLTFGGLSVLSAAFAYDTYRVLNRPNQSVIDALFAIPMIGIMVTSGGLALTSAGLSAISFKSAYDDVKN